MEVLELETGMKRREASACVAARAVGWRGEVGEVRKERERRGERISSVSSREKARSASGDQERAVGEEGQPERTMVRGNGIMTATNVVVVVVLQLTRPL